MNTPNRSSTKLRTQLVTHALLSVVVPIVLAGGLGFFFFTYHLDIIEASFERSREALTDNIVRGELIAQTSRTARQIDAFLIERITEAKSWASSAVVVSAAGTALSRHAAEGLTESTVDAIEARFRIDKSLNVSPEADAYLRSKVAASPYFAEIFFTDRNGFNVALTNPTSDFVQSDEEWWQSAWGRGISVGEVEYDDSAGVWSIEISVRIDDMETRKPIGVMKTVLAIEAIQEIADWTAQTIPGGRVQITTGGGTLIAETSSGHARDRIMNSDVDMSTQGSEAVRAAFGPERAGFATDQEWLTAYARTGGRDTYASTTNQFAGFDWIAILQKPLAGVVEPITALRSIEDALHDWRQIFVLALAVMALLSLVLAVTLAAAAAHRYAASLHAVRDMAERTARGEKVSPEPIRHPEEIAEVYDAVQQLSQVFMSILERSRSRG